MLQISCATNQALTNKITKLKKLDAPVSKTIAGVPFILQKENYCGPATLSMYLNWLGINKTPEQLAKESFSKNAQGTYKSNLISAARINALMTTPVNSYKDLVTEIANNNPVIVFQNLGFDWYPLWHYSLIYGYDLESQTLTLHSGEDKSKKMKISLFENSWQRADYWAITLTPTSKLSKSAKEFDYIKSAAALEKLNFSKNAKEAYHNILKRWPKSFMAYFGLGNIHYKNNQPLKAQTFYQKSVQLNPRFSLAWFNLALINEEANNLQAASRAAKSAILHANPRQVSLYKEKLSHLIQTHKKR
jgi:tetratricopeptide (TPR) repeat protein